jgi:Ni/Fe-hydrogenase 1 B-type cytochrome subunit
MATPVARGFRRVYVWELPVRIWHWVNALCIVILIATGFVIGNPFAIEYRPEAYQQYWFGSVRVLHFSAAFTLFFGALVRLYWSLAGNRYARWNEFVPLGRARLREMLDVIRRDILQLGRPRQASLGHNALAGLSYFLLFLAFLFQVATGFALYADMSQSWLPQLFAWVVPLMGGDMAVRQWHHAVMWVFVAFVIVHVYLVVYHELVDDGGALSSMIGGFEFERDSEARNASGDPR